MSMLSSVASRLFWLARYLERTQGTARIINAYSQLVLDVPKGSEIGWETLIGTIDAEEAFGKRYRNINEHNVLKFMISDTDNYCSLRFAVKAARENVRTSRDVLPEDTWEQVNEMYLYVEDWAEKSVGRRNRFEFLETLIAQTQQIQGLLYTILSRDHSFTFLKIGSMLERADMTSRVVDVAIGTILRKQRSTTNFMPFLWANLLLSLSANSAYRREIGPLIYADEAIDFVFTSPTFPRSVAYCLADIESYSARVNNSSAVEKVVSELKKSVDNVPTKNLDYEVLHAYIDRFQKQLYRLNSVIEKTWFIPTEQSN